ncbi:MAG TPA: NAD(P)H-binding protein [Arenimonas sp.]|uniref:NAD(P)H-binding protein n=1 Tax=Arenimonas sp. TaxID=1872635 RepID=UPI002BC33A2B|nr:NAD(P)H-binding protein [Arenimonas sp.]HMB56528.1 NAD(P)H-binding protein [Arenimonas sp.]
MDQADLPHARRAVVLVLGGSGFIGRHAVTALLVRGAQVIIGSRQPGRIDRKLPEGALTCLRRQARLEELQTPDDWAAALEGVDAVVNCVGILRQRGRETYQRVHHHAPAALAEACRQRQLRLIHVSALGLNHPARSRFLRSKVDGEAALRASGADWRIVRPSLLDGDGGYGALWIRRVAHWPIQLLPADAVGQIAALDVGELGEALAHLALRIETTTPDDRDREFDLGGPDQRTLSDYIAAIRRLHHDKPARCLRVPSLLARLGSHVCDLLHWTPFSFGHWELLRHDNCPQRNRLPELLGRAPRAIGAAPAGSGMAATPSIHGDHEVAVMPAPMGE